MSINEFTSGSDGSTEPDCMNVLPDVVTAAAVLSHPTSSGRIRCSAELSNVEQSFQGHVETIHSTGSSHAARLAEACITMTASHNCSTPQPFMILQRIGLLCGTASVAVIMLFILFFSLIAHELLEDGTQLFF